MGCDWSTDGAFNALMNKVGIRKFQPPNRIIVKPDLSDSAQMICASRVDTCQNRYHSRRTYAHKAYEYDNMNELERFGAGRYSRRYVLLVSFEDALDFVFSCLFKTKQGSLIKFCEDNNLDYRAYSRQLLGGGKYKDLYMNDLLGFSQAFDLVIEGIGKNDSIEKKLYFSKLYSFCEDFRNALMVHLTDKIDGTDNTILASAGISSLVYYSDVEIDDYITVKYKAYQINLKILCMKKNEYFNHVHECLSY